MQSGRARSAALPSWRAVGPGRPASGYAGGVKRIRNLPSRAALQLLALLLAPLATATSGGLAAPEPCAEPHPGRTPIVSPHAGAVASSVECRDIPLADVSAGPPGRAPVARLASLAGEASAQAPGGASRPLACGDAVSAGERVVTGAGSSAGLLVGDVLAQLGAESAVTVGLTHEATADLSLERGGLRIIDPRPGVVAVPARVAALGAELRIAGNDAEARVVSSAQGDYALLCEWDAPLRVATAAGEAVAARGSCIVAKPGEALAGATPQTTRIAALEGSCDPAPPLEPLTHLEPLPPTGAGPPGGAPPLPTPIARSPRSPCDNPGAACALGTTVVEQEPTTHGFPGGKGSFPGCD